MSHEQNSIAIGHLNSVLDTYRGSLDLSFYPNGNRPNFRVLSYNPFAYEQYGTFMNRGPKLYGALAVRYFSASPHPQGESIYYACVQTESADYGYMLWQNHLRAISAVLQDSGLDFKFS